MKNNKMFVIGAVVIAAIALVIFNFLPKAPVAEVAAPTNSTEKAQFIRPHSPTFGNSLGRVTVVEWFDPECEACRMVHPIFKKIVADYKDRVHFVLRYMPYHQGSMFAASALEEAKELGKFEEALDILFEKQPEWGDHHQPRPDLIPTYLAKLGIPADKLQKDYVIGKHGKTIEIDKKDGEGVGVRGTPSFFVNEVPVQELGDKPLRDAIDAALGPK